MAKEILAISEDDLEEVITLIRVGIKHAQISPKVKKYLESWCSEEENYLKRLNSDEEE